MVSLTLQLLEKIDVKTDLHSSSLARIDEHLKNLNGKVITNMKNIEENRRSSEQCHTTINHDVSKIKIQIAKWSGAIAVLMVTMQLSIAYFLK